MSQEFVSAVGDEELQAVIDDFQKLAFDENVNPRNLTNEYSTYGIYTNKSRHVEGVDITKSPSFIELYNTLVHLTDVQDNIEYELIVYSKGTSLKNLKAVNFSSRNTLDIDSKHFEIQLYKKPTRLEGSWYVQKCKKMCILPKASFPFAGLVTREIKCGVPWLTYNAYHLYNYSSTVREIDGPANMKPTKNNLNVKTIQTLEASSEILNLFPLLGYGVKKKFYVKSNVFHSNFGNTNHIQISLLRHFNTEDNKPLYPHNVLVELKCFGNLDIDYYKRIIQNYSKLLYKYVTF